MTDQHRNGSGQRQTMALPETVLGLGVCVVALIAAWQAYLIPVSPLYAKIGPTVFPYMGSAVLLGLGVLLDIAQVLHAGGMRLRGVMAHAGSSYDHDEPEALRRIAEQERAGTVRAAERLRQAGWPCPVVSIGSTPTALSAQSLAGVTEVRAGVYVFFDLVMRNVGVCAMEDLSLSVLTTVIGHQADKGWAIVDAGWMAMSRDRGTQKQKRDFGYGQVCDETGTPIEGFVLEAANQEHGIVARHGGADPDVARRFPLGTRLRILPNHACATGAQHPAYQAVLPGGEVQTWPRFSGW